jgi:hypothetical protein
MRWLYGVWAGSQACIWMYGEEDNSGCKLSAQGRPVMSFAVVCLPVCISVYLSPGVDEQGHMRVQHSAVSRPVLEERV